MLEFFQLLRRNRLNFTRNTLGDCVRIKAEEGDDNFARFKELFDEAHRAATGWKDAVAMIREKIESEDAIGDPPGEIPL